MSIPEYKSFSQHQKDIIANILSDDTTKRKRILGSAGSGKTMIMSYCASELVNQGKHVLLIIYNKTLIQQIKYMVNCYYNMDKDLFYKVLNNDVNEYVTIDNYHHFMWHNISDTDTFAELEYTS
jgi:DNA replication protein DnaC